MNCPYLEINSYGHVIGCKAGAPSYCYNGSNSEPNLQCQGMRTGNEDVTYYEAKYWEYCRYYKDQKSEDDDAQYEEERRKKEEKKAYKASSGSSQSAWERKLNSWADSFEKFLFGDDLNDDDDD